MTIKQNRAKKGRGKNSRRINSVGKFEALATAAAVTDHYTLRLFITGTTARSARAITNIRTLCEEYLAGRYDLEVIDIYQQPVKAMEEQIIAAPTLIKRLPLPLKRLIGNLAERDKVLAGLNLISHTTGRRKENAKA